jgi:single-stranded-DNA-specific exonuclease
VLFNQNWHKGVIGIVASRCIETYYRPTIILTESNGKIAGSARSVKGFDVYEALEQCLDCLEQFGGHKYAAGMTLRKEQIEDFQQRFEEVVAASIAEELLIPEIEIDSEIRLEEITTKFYRVLRQFAPFGPGNMKPLFLAKGLLERGFGRIVGEKHLKLELYDPDKPGIYYPAIAFNLAEKYELIRSGKPLDVVFGIEENEWNGQVSLQLKVKDLREIED